MNKNKKMIEAVVDTLVGEKFPSMLNMNDIAHVMLLVLAQDHYLNQGFSFDSPDGLDGEFKPEGSNASFVLTSGEISDYELNDVMDELPVKYTEDTVSGPKEVVWKLMVAPFTDIFSSYREFENEAETLKELGYTMEQFEEALKKSLQRY